MEKAAVRSDLKIFMLAYITTHTLYSINTLHCHLTRLLGLESTFIKAG